MKKKTITLNVIVLLNTWYSVIKEDFNHLIFIDYNDYIKQRMFEHNRYFIFTDIRVI